MNTLNIIYLYLYININKFEQYKISNIKNIHCFFIVVIMKKK